MPISISSGTLEKFTTFGDLLRFLRRRVGITQVELALAVGYSDTQISRLEQNQRPPDIPTIEARFISALDLENEPKVVSRLLDLAANVRREDAPGPGLCPYKGLSYFDESDADLFVGREELTAKLTERVLFMNSDEPAAQMRFLAVVGASGSGKSSLVRAGMVPALRWDNKSADWHIHILTPTAHPLESLATSLTLDDPTVTSTAMLMDDLLEDERSLHLFAVRKLQKEKHSHLLLVIDQFEEVFALCRSERERAAFIGNLLTAMSEPDGPISVVITLRADFYAHCANYGQLRKTLSQNQEYIGAMDTDELRRAIEEPALSGNWNLEPGLVDVLLRDVGQEPGALPLLSHALMETWQRRRGRTMTLGGYTSSGGVHGAIAETAETVYLDQLTNEQKSIARRIFIRLTEFGDEMSVVDTRRRATFDELILKPEEAASTRAVLKSLADARLIITNENSVEVAHEALIREWPTLRDWLEKDREGLQLHRRLTETAREWETLERDDGVLYRGAQLAQVREWAESNPNALSANENEFLNVSIAFEQNKAAEHEAQQKRELEAAQKLAEMERQSGIRLRLRNRVISAVGVIAIILAGVAFALSKQSSENAQTALNAQSTAQSNADLAESEARVRATAQANLQTSLVEEQRRRLIAEANSLLGMGESGELPALLALQSLKINYDPEAQALLYRALDQGFTLQKFEGHGPNVWNPSFSPDGHHVLTAGEDTIRLWDPETGEELKRIASEGGANPTFSPDGKWVVSGSPGDHAVRFWDVETGNLIRTLEGHEAFVYVPIFSADGKYMLTFSDDHTARLWDPNDGKMIYFLEHPAPVTGAAISPDDRTILTAGLDFMIREWDIQTGKPLRVFEHPNEDGVQIQTLQYAPDGKTFFSAPVNNMVYQWEVESGKILNQFTVSKDERLIFADISPSGRSLIAGSTENIIYLWEVESGKILRTYTGHHSNIYGLDFSPDERSFVAGEEGGTPRLWATMERSEPFIFRGNNGRSLGAAFSSDGKAITSDDNGIVQIWDVLTGKTTLQIPTGGDQMVASVEPSPKGKHLLTAGNTTVLWDIHTGEEIQRFDHKSFSIAFSPDERQLLTGGLDDGTIYLWNTVTGEREREYTDHTGPISDLKFSDDAQEILSASWDATAILWDVQTGNIIRRYQHQGALNAALFHPDGKRIITTAGDNLVRIWDKDTGVELRRFNAPTGNFNDAFLMPDGEHIMVASTDGTARLYELDTGNEVGRYQGHKEIVFNLAISSDGMRMLTSSWDGTARVWSLDTDDLIQTVCDYLPRDLTPGEWEQYFSDRKRNVTCPK